MHSLHSYALLALLALPFFTACTDEESDLGIDLVDTTTLYQGLYDTLYADDAWTEYDDSLTTTNLSYGVIGYYHDATFGSVSSMLFTQLALPSNVNSIDLDSMTIDSVVLSLAKTQLFPDTSATYHFHFEVKQLAEPVRSDTTYYAYDQVPVENTTYFDAVVPVTYYDSVITLRLDSSFHSLIRRSATAEDFIDETKGLRVRILGTSDEGMVTIDFSSVKSCLRAYYHSSYDTVSSVYTIFLGNGAVHFTHFEHNYAGTLFSSGNAVPGSYRLYLEPFAGHRVRLSFDRDLQAFHAAHPYAVIHHAELLLSVAPESVDTDLPDQLLTLGKNTTGSGWIYIDDLINTRDFAAYDGTYHSDINCYRIRVSQYLQGLLRIGYDPGFRIHLNSARHLAQRVLLNGLSTTNRPRIAIVFSE